MSHRFSWAPPLFDCVDVLRATMLISACSSALVVGQASAGALMMQGLGAAKVGKAGAKAPGVALFALAPAL